MLRSFADSRGKERLWLHEDTRRRSWAFRSRSRAPTPSGRARGYDPRSAAAGRRTRADAAGTLRRGTTRGNAAIILDEGQNTILDLCREFGIALTPHKTVGAELPRVKFDGRLLDPEEIGACFGELVKAQSARPAEPFETAAAWVRRCRLSAPAIALLDVLIEIQPSIPLRFVDARGLHLGPERYLQMAERERSASATPGAGPGRASRADRAPDRLVSLVRRRRDREGEVRGRPRRPRRSWSADDRHRLEPSTTGGEGARTRLAALRDRSRCRSAVP